MEQTKKSIVNRRPLGCVALLLVLSECLLVAAGLKIDSLVLLTLLVAPGFALLPLLPKETLKNPWAALAAVPAVAVATTVILVITLSTAGLKLTPTTLLIALLIVVLTALLAPIGSEPQLGKLKALPGAGLLIVLTTAVIVERLVIGGTPVPGNDWGHYLLYAQEIARHGQLLIDNPYWMLGTPFREDPGTPALYGSYLILSGQQAGVLVHGIWLLALIGILSIFSYVATLWGNSAGLIAAAIYATVPINLNILGWHGLANVSALALAPLILMLLTVLIRSGLGWRQSSLLALLSVALFATHRLSATIVFLVALATVSLAFLFKDRLTVLKGAARAVAAALPLSISIVYDTWQRSSTAGGTQSYRSYLATKIELDQVLRSLTVGVVVLGALALGFMLWQLLHKRKIEYLPLLLAALVLAGLAYAWIVHIPLFYFRIAYYLPLVLAPAIAIALTRLLRDRMALLASTALVVVVVFTATIGQAHSTKRFYQFVDHASLRGLGITANHLQENDIVLTDRCWSFLATYLIQHPILAAEQPEDIQPAAEVRPAKLARQIFRGDNRGTELAEKLRIRYALADPQCTDSKGKQADPPKIGKPVYVSERLVVLKIN